jgi:hypothetical protein
MLLVVVVGACSGPASSGSDVVDLNLALAAELAELPGIDRPLADSIVDYRRFHGPFASPATLVNVPAMARRMAEVESLVEVTTCSVEAPCPSGACVSGVCARTDDGPIAYTTVAADRWNFSRAGAPWVPVGVNYDHHPDRLSLVAFGTHLDAIDADFADLAALGFDAARVTAYFYDVLSGPDQPDPERLEILDEVVLSARRHGIYLDLTGLALYDRAQVPAWLPALDDAAFRAQERFYWQTVAARYAHDPTIFAFDLQNEPFLAEGNSPDIVGPEFADTGMHFGSTITRNLQVPWQAWVHAKYGDETALEAAWGTAWPAPGETWDSIGFAGIGVLNQARSEDGIDFRNEHAAAWAAELVAAIRSSGAPQLVTVPVGAPFGPLYFYTGATHLAPIVDFMSVHLYPDPTSIDEIELCLRSSAIDMPVLIEEMAPYIPPAETDVFLTRTVGSASGWFAFYDGRSAEELMMLPAPAPAQGAWLARFTRFAAEEIPRGGVSRIPGAEVEQTSIKRVRTDPIERQRLLDANAAQRMAGAHLDVVLAP